MECWRVVVLRKEDAIGTVLRHDCMQKNKRYVHRRTFYIFLCSGCNNRIEVRNNVLHKHSGRCKACGTGKKPYEALYNCLKRVCKDTNKELGITYEQFIDLTAVSVCHYCEGPVTWSERNVWKNGSGYNLDRKDSSKGYTKENIVVCCGDCNRIKWDVLTYEEMKAAIAAVKLFREQGYYKDKGKVVFGAKYLLQRGYCCGSGCRHCPYGKDIQRAANGKSLRGVPEASRDQPDKRLSLPEDQTP